MWVFRLSQKAQQIDDPREPSLTFVGRVDGATLDCAGRLVRWEPGANQLPVLGEVARAAARGGVRVLA